eukprot:1178740-Prorocentrum_minimum.AAC.2
MCTYKALQGGRRSRLSYFTLLQCTSAPRAPPVPPRHFAQRWTEAVQVPTRVAAVAHQHQRRLPGRAAHLARQVLVQLALRVVNATSSTRGRILRRIVVHIRSRFRPPGRRFPEIRAPPVALAPPPYPLAVVSPFRRLVPALLTIFGHISTAVPAETD